MFSLKHKTFRKGGIHPSDCKIARNNSIEEFPLSKTVVIPLGQSIGAPAKAIVSKDDFVKTGQIIAKADGFVSANIHSSVTGKVIKIDDYGMLNGYTSKSIFIETSDDEWADDIDLTNDITENYNISPEQINQKIQEMGIVGLGGATFPTNVKFKIPADKKIHSLIINGVECEPYLTADHRLMLEYGKQIIIGSKLILKAVDAKKCYIGIESNKKDAIENLKELSKNYPEIEIISLKVKYPQGAEKQLIKSITGREVPSGKLPFEVGCVVSNVGTTYAVYQAVMKNMPLIKRVVTVAGKNLKNSYNFLIRIGTPINNIIDHIGGIPDNTYKIISGGPMMGKSISNINSPILKGTSGIVFLTDERNKNSKYFNCIHCGKCISVCPMGLEPYFLEKLVKIENWEKLEHHNIMDCVECGSCNFICPANRFLLDNIKVGKLKVGNIIRNRIKK